LAPLKETDSASRPAMLLWHAAPFRLSYTTLTLVTGNFTLFLLYFVTAKLGLKLDAVSGFATTVWPPTGISLVALALFGTSLWPGIAAGAFLVNLSAGAPVAAACGMAMGNTLEALVGSYLLRRFGGFRGSLDRLRSVFALIVLSAGLSTMLSATFGVVSGYLGGVIAGPDFARAWTTWWLGDAMGVLILAPLLFMFCERPRILLENRRLLEGATLLAMLIAVSLFVFMAPPAPQRGFLPPFLIFPLLIWAALRFGRFGTAATTFVVACIAVGMTALGLGPFKVGSVNDSLLLLQEFMGIAAVTMLVLSAGVSERRTADRRLRINYSVSRLLADPSAPEGDLTRILQAICENLGWECGNSWWVDTASNTLAHSGSWHRSRSRLAEYALASSGVVFPRGVGMAGRVWSEGRALWVADAARDPAFLRAALARKMGLRSAMGFPILMDDKVLGVMTFLNRKVQEPDEMVLQMMANIGSQIGQFIQRRRAESDLKQAHAELEDRIARRTAQLFEKNRELQEEIGERQQMEASLRELSNRLLRIQDEERRRLARELHDSTAQNLAALSMNLAVAGREKGSLDERSRLALEESEALAERCSREIRSLSYLLHPPLLEEVGLLAALRWCADGFSQRSGIRVDLALPPHFNRLPLDIENALFRIVQECLTNIQRHSGSETAWIRLARLGEGVVLEVRDEGRGIPAEILDRRGGVKSLGVGLLGMRERVQQLGGKLAVESGEGGARVRVEIPVPGGAS
jgi:signal transduction histidine kinase